MKGKSFAVDIYSAPKLKDIPKERVMAIADKMVERGLIEWVDKSKGLAKITDIGVGVHEAKQPSN